VSDVTGVTRVSSSNGPGGLRVAYAGTPAFARVALQAICDAGWTVPLVLTQPDRPAGRGMKLQLSPVKQLALERGLPLAQPAALKLDGRHGAEAAAAQAALQAAAPDVLVVAAYGLILPAWALALPRLGCLNIHGSLLPRWRGAAPIQRAIEAGDAQTGITLMQMDSGLDTGPALLAAAEPILPDDTTTTLHDRLAALGAKLVLQGLQAAAEGTLQPQRQPAAGVTYAYKIEKTEAAIDWRAPASAIERRLRAFDPFPGCTATLAGESVKLWRGRVVRSEPGAEPGRWLPQADGSLVIACGEDALQWLELQQPGGRRMDAAEWRRRHPLALP
jgi:methionyl-tRNA formyltransferase